MSAITHLARLLAVVGAALLVMSFLFPAGIQMSGGLSPDITYEAQYFLVTDDMYLHVSPKYGTNNFSLYVLSYEDMLQFLESGTLEGTNPLFVLENVSEYDGVVDFPSPGIYGSLITRPANTSVFVQGMMLAQPRLSFIITGLILISPMAIIIIYWLFREKLDIWEFKKSPKW
jgi:hypothetical protein